MQRQLSVEPLEARNLMVTGFADVVIEYNPGPGAGAQWDDPTNALGDPEEKTYCALGAGGSIVLGFVNTPTVDGPGKDFRVVESGASESASVFVSGDFGETFVRIGRADGDAEFDLRSVRMQTMNAIKLVDALPSEPFAGHVGDGHQGFDLDAVIVLNAAFVPEAGDANEDGLFDQMDIGIVLLANKFGTGQAATWGEGDWNADSVFDQLDIVSALQTGNYLQGPYAAEAGSLVKPSESEVLDELFADLGT